MEHLGKVSEKPGSLKMSLQRQGGGRRTSVGTECARVLRWSVLCIRQEASVAGEVSVRGEGRSSDRGVRG